MGSATLKPQPPLLTVDVWPAPPSPLLHDDERKDSVNLVPGLRIGKWMTTLQGEGGQRE